MGNPHAVGESIPMVVAAFAATGFAVAGIHAYLLVRDRFNAFHRRALEIALLVSGVTAVLQPLSGDVLAKDVARHQPAKLAAFEALFRTQAGAP